MIHNFPTQYLIVIFLFTVIRASSVFAQFTTIINVPPDVEFIINSNTQLNLSDGGVIGRPYTPSGFSPGVDVGSSVTLSGPTENIEVNISGGEVIGEFSARNGATVNISGGSFGGLSILADSTVTLFGGDFRLDGSLIGGLETIGDSQPIEVIDGRILSGTLTDGSTFATILATGGLFGTGSLTLEATAIPPLGPELIMVPSSIEPRGLGNGQTLVVDAGGTIRNNFTASWGSTVIVSGGEVGHGFKALGSSVSINGGFVSSEGTALPGSSVTLSGGIVDNFFSAKNSSEVHVAGGVLGNGFRADEGSTIMVSGGALGDGFGSAIGSKVKMLGSYFHLDGVPLSGLDRVGDELPFDLPFGSVLSGTLSDGTPFAFSSADRSPIWGGDAFAPGSLTLVETELSPLGQSELTVPGDAAPLGIRSGQTLWLQDGGVLGDHFSAGHGSTLDISGGRIGNNLEVVDATVAISGGQIGERFDLFGGSSITITGGSIGNDFEAYSGALINISGGSISGDFDMNGARAVMTGGTIGGQGFGGKSIQVGDGSVFDFSAGAINGGFGVGAGSTVNITGGMIRSLSAGGAGSTVNIAGGSIGADLGDSFSTSLGAFGGSTITISGSDSFFGNQSSGVNFDAYPGSIVNLVGTEFLLNGTDITDQLIANESFTVENRTNNPFGDPLILSGILADGSPFSFHLISWNIFENFTRLDYFDPNATLNIILVPEPSVSVLLLTGVLVLLLRRT